MKVLHITTNGPNVGGVSEYIWRLSRDLASYGCDVTIAGGTPIECRGDTQFDWVPIKSSGHPIDLWLSARVLNAKGRFDIIHAHYRKSALIGRMLARKQEIPLLFTLHLSGVPMHFPYNVLSEFGDVTHAPSRMAMDWLASEARIPQQRLALIPHGVDPASFPQATPSDRQAARKALGLDSAGLVAAYVGRFEYPKNVTWIADLARAMPKVTFLMMGRGEDQAFLNDAPLHLLPYGNPLKVYQAADILLLPSSREGFGLVAAEAMSVGTTVLRTRTAGTEEMIIEGKTGFSCAIDREEFLAKGQAVIADRSKLLKMGEEAARYVRTKLSHRRQVEQTLQIYRDMVSARRCRRLHQC